MFGHVQSEFHLLSVLGEETLSIHSLTKKKMCTMRAESVMFAKESVEVKWQREKKEDNFLVFYPELLAFKISRVLSIE